MYTEDKIGFECVQPIESHARLIMEWRNDPETLKMSFHQQPKKWESFFKEFTEEYFSIPELPPLFVLWEGQRAAFLRFHIVEHPNKPSLKCCDISINVAPDKRGQGIGSYSLETIKRWVALQGFDAIYAEVKPENTSSQKAFQAAGYQKLNDIEKQLPDIGQTATVTRYLAELHPEKKVSRTFIIAEAGSNWRVGSPERDLAMARDLIHAAVDAGADAVKFQVFRPETTYVQNAGSSDYLSEAGIKEDISSIFANLALPYEMIPELASYCKTDGIAFMASAFSQKDFEAIDPYVSIHKIASYEIGHVRLIELAARSGKPVFISTGAALEDEIAWALDTFREHGGKDITLLQCTARYPAKPTSMNLSVIPWLKNRFHVEAGLSDHSRDPICAPVAAVALGAKVIEKHLTMDNNLTGPDHTFALEPHEFKFMVHSIRQTEKMLGSGVKIIQESEQELRLYARRGIQALLDIKKGEIFHEGINIDILRPGKQKQGIHPKYIVAIEGKASTRSISAGSGIQLGDWEK